MATTSPDQIRYPEGNDPPKGAEQIEHVAKDTQAALTARDSQSAYASASGHLTIDATANTVASAHVDFPVGRFTVQPLITANMQSGSPNDVNPVVHNNVTTSGCDIHIYRNNTVTTGVDWYAVQMTPASAEG
ncbi:MAG: hypothetical protein ACRDMV_01325 [Streptosporangiales bacterium]